MKRACASGGSGVPSHAAKARNAGSVIGRPRAGGHGLHSPSRERVPPGEGPSMAGAGMCLFRPAGIWVYAYSRKLRLAISSVLRAPRHCLARRTPRLSKICAAALAGRWVWAKARE